MRELSRATRVLPGVCAALAACAGYRPGSFVSGGEPFVGDLTTAGCLDLAVAVARDPVATGPVVHYQFGNRCDRVATIDLGGVRVTGRTAAGAEVALVAYDPDGAIRPLPLDARSAGRERIEYRQAGDDGAAIIAVCVGLGALAAPGAARLQVSCHDLAPRIAEVTP